MAPIESNSQQSAIGLPPPIQAFPDIAVYYPVDSFIPPTVNRPVIPTDPRGFEQTETTKINHTDKSSQPVDSHSNPSNFSNLANHQFSAPERKNRHKVRNVPIPPVTLHPMHASAFNQTIPSSFTSMPINDQWVHVVPPSAKFVSAQYSHRLPTASYNQYPMQLPPPQFMPQYPSQLPPPHFISQYPTQLPPPQYISQYPQELYVPMMHRQPPPPPSNFNRPKEIWRYSTLQLLRLRPYVKPTRQLYQLRTVVEQPSITRTSVKRDPPPEFKHRPSLNPTTSQRSRSPDISFTREKMMPPSRNTAREASRHVHPKPVEDFGLKIRRQIKSLLNRLTIELFERVAEQLGDLLEASANEVCVRIHAEEVFSKAISEPNFSEMYADVVIVMFARSPNFIQTEHSDGSVSSDKVLPQEAIALMELKKLGTESKLHAGVNGPGVPSDLIEKTVVEKARVEKSGVKQTYVVNFKREFLNQCQNEFKDFITLKLDGKGLDEDQMEAIVTKRKRRVLGNILFIGELAKRNILKVRTTKEVAQDLLREETPHEYFVECACELLTNIGYFMERHTQTIEMFNQLLSKLEQLKRKFNSRIRFKIQDLLDLRANGWIAKLKNEKATTLDQLHQKIAIEALHGGAVMLAQEGQFATVGQPTPQAYDKYLDKHRKVMRLLEKNSSVLLIQSVLNANPIPSTIRRNTIAVAAISATQTEGVKSIPPTMSQSSADSLASPVCGASTELSARTAELVQVLESDGEVDKFISNLFSFKQSAGTLVAEFNKMLEMTLKGTGENPFVVISALTQIYNTGKISPQRAISHLLGCLRNLDEWTAWNANVPALLGRLVAGVVTETLSTTWLNSQGKDQKIQPRIKAGTVELLRGLQLTRGDASSEFLLTFASCGFSIGETLNPSIWVSSALFGEAVVVLLRLRSKFDIEDVWENMEFLVQQIEKSLGNKPGMFHVIASLIAVDVTFDCQHVQRVADTLEKFQINVSDSSAAVSQLIALQRSAHQL